MPEGADQPAAAAEVQVARRPYRGQADVAGEDGAGSSQIARGTRDLLGMQPPARLALGQVVQVLARLAVVIARLLQEVRVRLGLETREKSLQRGLDVADEAELDGVAPADGLGPQVHLGHVGVVGVELRVREVRAQHQQRVAVLHRV